MRDPLDGIKTKRGRVVYDRTKNPFRVSDSLRILRKLGIRINYVAEDRYQAIVEALVDMEPHFSFGGGSFGGAGSSGTFVAGKQIGRIIVIIEER